MPEVQSGFKGELILIGQCNAPVNEETQETRNDSGVENCPQFSNVYKQFP